jgi:thioredoxin 1
MKKAIIILSIILLIGVLSAVNKTITKAKAVAKVKPLITFVELGSVNCIPCKQMKPVMAEIEKEYGDKIAVVFHDVNVERQWSSTYKIKLIPTQVFLDSNGKEFYRHEGFFPAKEIMKLVDKKLGIKRTETADSKDKK